MAPGADTWAAVSCPAPVLAYGGLTALTFLSWPTVRRADLTLLLLAFVAGLEGPRAVGLWHGSIGVLAQSLASVVGVYGLSYTERFRSAARQASEARFDVRGGRRRRRDARSEGQGASPLGAWPRSNPAV